MNKHLLVFALGATFALSALAQTDPAPITTAEPPPNVDPPKPWNMELQTGINLNQASYSDNWKAGGTNSVAVSVFLNGKANRKWDRSEWTNNLQLLYGNIQNKGQDLKKNADRIFFESKYSYRLHKHWNVFGSVNFMSQFADGYDYYYLKDVNGKDSSSEQSRRISGILSPGYLTEALGLEYKPVSYFSAQFGLGALRQTFVRDQSLYNIPGNDSLVLYGVKKGEYMRNQIVFQFVANFDKEIMKNIFLKARYMNLFDYQNLNSQGIVTRLDASITAKVNRFVNVNLTGVILYDFDQDKDIQYSQVLSLGILYGISNQPDKK
jgi:hypothetical protein